MKDDSLIHQWREFPSSTLITKIDTPFECYRVMKRLGFSHSESWSMAKSKPEQEYPAQMYLGCVIETEPTTK